MLTTTTTPLTCRKIGDAGQQQSHTLTVIFENSNTLFHGVYRFGSSLAQHQQSSINSNTKYHFVRIRAMALSFSHCYDRHARSR